MALETIVLGGGCFWCLEAVFQRLSGVERVVSGYAGGQTENPTYQAICSGATGHAEVVRVHYNPEQCSLAEVLDLFWRCHDPTTLNRQGADVGTQYRSIILYQGLEQKQAAETSMEGARNGFSQPIVTEISPLTRFYEAEPYHQDYYNDNKQAGYCRVVIQPKLDKLGMT